MPLLDRSLLLCLLLASPPHVQCESSTERRLEAMLDHALRLTKGAGGETAVGIGMGIVGGFGCKQLTGLALKGCVTAGAVGIGAYCLGIVDDTHVHRATRVLHESADQALALLPKVLRRLDIDKDGTLSRNDGKLALSKVAPFVKRHVGFTGGLLSGFAAGYSLG